MAVESPLLIMLVGLPGSGKSTAAERLASVVRSQGRPCEIVGTDVYLEAEDGLRSRQSGRCSRPLIFRRPAICLPAIGANSGMPELALRDDAGA